MDDDVKLGEHSAALLLPDGKVLMGGHNVAKAQIFSPPYLFDANGERISEENRPKIDTVTSPQSNVMYYGKTTTITTQPGTDPGDIDSVSLIRLGGATHGIDQDTRFVKLEKDYDTETGILTVAAPTNGNAAPPGYYMLFIVHDTGVPSVARIIRLGSDCNDNGTFDFDEIADGTSTDCNSNAVPDGCEPWQDCQNDGQGNGTRDSCDIAAGTSADCNENWTPDECELTDNDCNTNQIPDDCDIGAETSFDCNFDGKPDECDNPSVLYPPTSPGNPEHQFPKNRYLSISPCGNVALKGVWPYLGAALKYSRPTSLR